MSKFLTTILLLSFACLSSVDAQSYKTYLKKGDAFYDSGEYEKAEKQYQAAKVCDDARSALVMLDNKINEARKKLIQQLEKLVQQEQTLRQRAEEDQQRITRLQAQTEAARRNIAVLGLALRTRISLLADKNIEKAMRLTALGMRCIDPGNPVFLLEFMEEYTRNKSAPAFQPLPYKKIKSNTTTADFAFAPTEKLVALSSYNKPNLLVLKIDDTGEISVTDSISNYDPCFISLSHDGTRLAFNTFKKPETIYILRLNDGRILPGIETITAKPERMTGIAYLDEGPNLLISYPNALVIWDTDQKRLKKEVSTAVQLPKANQNPTLVTFNNYVGWSNIETIQIWDYSPETPVLLPFHMSHSAPIIDLASSADGKYLLSGAKDGNLKLWELASGIELKSYKTVESLNKIAIDAAGKRLATGDQNGSVSVWDLETGSEILKLPVVMQRCSIKGLEFIERTNWLLVSYSNGETYSWNLDINAIIQHLYAQTGKLTGKDFTVKDIKQLNLYELLTQSDGGIDSLIQSRDTVIMVSLADYVIDMIELESDFGKLGTYFGHAERLYTSSGEQMKLANLYNLWSKALLENGNIASATRYLNKALALGESTDKLKLTEAHLQLLSGAYEKAIPNYLNSLTVNASLVKEVNNENLVESFRRLSIARPWQRNRKNQMDVEKALRLIGVPLTSNPSLAAIYGIQPLQTSKQSLGDLIRELTGTASLSETLVDQIIHMYKYEAEQVIRPKRRAFSNADNYPEAAKAAEMEIVILEDILSVKPNSEIKTTLGQTQGSYSYYLLFTKQYKLAQEAAIAGFQNCNKYWVKTNLGHAYLLAGDKEKAKEIYMDIKDRWDDSQSDKEIKLKIALLADFEALVKYGLRHPSIPEFAAMLLEHPLTEEEKVKYGASN